MKLAIVIMIMLLACGAAFADRIEIPFECYPKKVQSALLAKGFKVDLNGSDRSEDSWGLLENEGTRFSIITYRPITMKELQTVKEAILK